MLRAGRSGCKPRARAMGYPAGVRPASAAMLPAAITAS
jgi:hypothetical protein